MTPITFAIFAALFYALWTFFHKLASPHINLVFGAILVSLTAVIFGSIFFFTRARGEQLITDNKGILFIVLAGISAFCLDYFVLQAYAKGLPLSIGAPVIIGGSMAIAVTIGFFIGESITTAKIIGILLTVAGGVILASVSQ